MQKLSLKVWSLWNGWGLGDNIEYPGKDAFEVYILMMYYIEH